MTPDNEIHFTHSQDIEEMQAVVLAASVRGDEACRAQLPRLAPGFEEPYRTVASAVVEMILGGAFIDPNTMRAALAHKKLTRRAASGRVEELTASQAVDLICATPVEPGQAAAYLPMLQDELETRRRAELRERAQETARQYGDDPNRLLREIEALALDARRGANEEHVSEALRFLPYFRDMMERQVGTEFLGLDSGFPLVNLIGNGLDAGLWVIAAPPSMGKTTFVWQVCQRVAEINRVPVLFISMEQSAAELRVKALARLARLNSRHIARGRLRSDNPEDLERLQDAARQYFHIGRHLTIIEGDDTTTIDTICAAAAAKKARAGTSRCLIAIDYLQIVPLREADAGRTTSTKDRLDLHVSALRRMARQLDSPVIAISSQNRSGYGSKRLDVFKESGGIEFSADIAGVMTLDKEATRSANGAHRVIDLNVVKNRNGETGVVKLKFYADRAEFIESGRASLPEEADE